MTLEKGDKGWVIRPQRWAGAYCEVISLPGEVGTHLTVRSLKEYCNPKSGLRVREGERVSIYETAFQRDHQAV